MLSSILIARGVRRIRLTGGEPLVRRGILSLIETLGQHIGEGLDELTLTTNGTQLADCAKSLYQSGVRRLNVSLDSLDPEKFGHITRTGDLAKVLGAGLDLSRPTATISVPVAIAFASPRPAQSMAALATARMCSCAMPCAAADPMQCYFAIDRVLATKAERHDFDIASARLINDTVCEPIFIRA